MMWNERVIKKTLTEYPGLELILDNSEQIVKGSLEVINGVSFNIELMFPENYPWVFPIVKEVGGKIPQKPERHVNSDGSLCLAVRPAELAICKKGLSFKAFIDNVLVPHLAREFVREETGNYPQGEYSHGVDGIWEFFQERFALNDKSKVLELIEIAINDAGIDKYEVCLCGSEKRLKFCHYPICLEVRAIGKENLRALLVHLKS